MEILNFESIMRDKLAECDEWLCGKDAAAQRLDSAEKEYVAAKEAFEEYTDDNIAKVTAYKSELKARLGIVDEPEVAEVPVADEISNACIEEEQIIG